MQISNYNPIPRKLLIPALTKALVEAYKYDIVLLRVTCMEIAKERSYNDLNNTTAYATRNTHK